ncbi:hypothetical protein CPB84DRAFT_1852111 [Gymnopilus junonius]|uniref:Uncharacterized protein n=1 Tax=Gymnopilus junonius TaxID=109634 RepID=A0A9P5TIK8_GYMJU|nr:hypothetical protein CPB84DRAFT_1852111 [Gymnopilus junonius]
MPALPSKITEKLFIQHVLVRDDLPENLQLTPCTSYLDASEWDPALWPPSTIPETASIKKGVAKSQYLLKDKEMIDLPYKPAPGYYGWPAKLYYKRDVERRSWEKYGGPSGFQAAWVASNMSRKCKGSQRLSKKSLINDGKKMNYEREAQKSISASICSPRGRESRTRAFETPPTLSSPAPREKKDLNIIGEFSAMMQKYRSTASLPKSKTPRRSVTVSNHWRGSSPTMVGSSPPAGKQAGHVKASIEVIDVDEEAGLGSTRMKSYHSDEVLELTDSDSERSSSEKRTEKQPLGPVSAHWKRNSPTMAGRSSAGKRSYTGEVIELTDSDTNSLSPEKRKEKQLLPPRKKRKTKRLSIGIN